MFGDLGYSTGIFYCKTWGSVAAHLRARDGQDLADVDIERAFKDQYCTAGSVAKIVLRMINTAQMMCPSLISLDDDVGTVDDGITV